MTDFTAHPLGILCLIVFFASYTAILFEDKLHLRKSKPIMFGAGLIWAIIGILGVMQDIPGDVIHHAVSESLGEYGALFLFLLSAMTYINALQDRNVFEVLRMRLLRAGLNLRQLFWVTGFMAFFLSPVADNLTTALVIGAVAMAVGGNNKQFIVPACINIVCAANAGGAFSPFGDITTLMVWQAGKVDFFEFFALFVPCVINFIVPAFIMSLTVPREAPSVDAGDTHIKYGGKVIIALGIVTIIMAISFEQILHLPAYLGMMMGLSMLMMMAWHIRRQADQKNESFVIFDQLAAVEWDTLLFFFGVMFSVSGLAFLGYLEFMSTHLYGGWGANITNIVLGMASAIIDNIPLMFAVLQMDPPMSHFEWMLITLTTGVGGTLLSVGS
ncbi:MAG TPA: sodium:proton antiporter NhaD, partial [Alphaproteobacteria bacterium]